MYIELMLCAREVFVPKHHHEHKNKQHMANEKSSKWERGRRDRRQKCNYIQRFCHTIHEMCIVSFWSEWKCHLTMVRWPLFSSHIRLIDSFFYFGFVFAIRYSIHFGHHLAKLLSYWFHWRFLSSLFIRSSQHCCFWCVTKKLFTSSDWISVKSR